MAADTSEVNPQNRVYTALLGQSSYYPFGCFRHGSILIPLTPIQAVYAERTEIGEILKLRGPEGGAWETCEITARETDALNQTVRLRVKEIPCTAKSKPFHEPASKTAKGVTVNLAEEQLWALKTLVRFAIASIDMEPGFEDSVDGWSKLLEALEARA